MNQKERLLNHLELHGSINPLQAWTQLGLYRLADAVYRLRNEGYAIETQELEVTNQFGEVCKVAEYKYTNPFTTI